MKITGLQPVWKVGLFDKKLTDAQFLVCQPIPKEVVFVCDQKWEGKRIDYNNVFKDGDIYRMYYLSNFDPNAGLFGGVPNVYVCYAQSKDGLNWEKPKLGICEYKGSKDTNIILRTEDLPDKPNFYDNFFVFKDTNPNCRKQEQYKALAYYNAYKLSTYVSKDGLNFTLANVLDLEGYFDSLNTCAWDERTGKYVAYIRSFHDIPENGDLNLGKRDVRRTESEDFINWTKPKLISFIDSEDYPLYTNHIRRYYRNSDIYIGFPVRYTERQDWTDNYEELHGKQLRIKRMKEGCKRYGLAVTDNVFMTSNDGLNWFKYDEAFIDGGTELEYNWKYGDAYLSYFLLETLAADGVNKELSMFVPFDEYDPNSNSTKRFLRRYTIRRDGFVALRAPYSGAKAVTNPFEYNGGELFINFASSARGGMYITVESEDGISAATCELFGNSDDRHVIFKELKNFEGKNIRLKFTMRDCKLFAFEIR